MKHLTVWIGRWARGEPREGLLLATVVQDGQHGADMLRRYQISKVETAQREAASQLRALLPGVEIEFEIHA